MQILAWTLAGFYMVLLFLVTIYSLGQFQLLVFYRRNKKRNEKSAKPIGDVNDSNLPVVTIQLPMYNELYVAERLIDAVAKIKYPVSKMEIQVLDDSTDETVGIVANKVKEYQALGYDITHVRREIRKGYKAGALAEGMKTAKGEFIAIFDADFIPSEDFLLRTIPYFENEKTGVVQTRWEHLNKDYSLLTKIQALQLDVHFTVEQMGRSSGNCFLQFNGTGGVWRRRTIDEAGGWEADTLTEDLDLSYRAQLKGWKIVFLEEVTSPGELPAEMNGLKSQQFRWTKGGAETARKMLPIMWRSALTPFQKVQATFHLMGSTMFVLVFLMALLNVPIFYFYIKGYYPPFDLRYVPVFYLSLVMLTSIFYTTHVMTLHREESFAKRLLRLIYLYPIFLTMSIGMSLHNTVAVLQGWIGKKTAFVRTPKFNIVKVSDSIKTKSNGYLSRKISWVTIVEGLMCLLFLYTFSVAYSARQYNFVVFHAMYAIGFGTICFVSIRHLRLK